MVANVTSMIVHPAQTEYIKKMAEANGTTLKDLKFKQYSRLANNFSRMAEKEALSKNSGKVLNFLKKHKGVGIAAAAGLAVALLLGNKNKEAVATEQPKQQLNVAA